MANENNLASTRLVIIIFFNSLNNTEYFTADGTGVETGSRDADGVHPNSKGHKIMAQKLFEFINSGLNL